MRSDAASKKASQLRSPNRAEPLGALERALQRSLTRWANHHASRYSEIGVVDYDPGREPAQRVDVAVSRAYPLEELSLSARLKIYLENGGPASEAALAEFSRPRGAGGATRSSLGSRISDLVESGKSVAVLSGHADRLDDIGGFAGALALSSSNPNMLSRNGVILNKVMSRETFRGQSVVELMRPFANIYWVIPATASAKRWNVPSEAVRLINGNALRSLLADVRRGAAITFAPAGSAMVRETDAAGRLVALRMPVVSASTMKLLTRFHAYVVAARWDDRVAVSDLVRIKRSRTTGEAGERLAAEATVRIAQMTEALSGVQVLQDERPADDSTLE